MIPATTPKRNGLSWTCRIPRASVAGMVGSLLLLSQALATDDRAAAFDQANKLYEQGQYAGSAAAYQRLADAGPSDVAVFFNLGNAWFKAGHPGLAIAAYHRARDLAPRDPGVRFNLQFVRQSVTGKDVPAGRIGARILSSMTLNEWAVLTACGVWLWFGLLALREWRTDLRPALRSYTAAAGGVVLLLGAGTGLAWQHQRGVERGVVVVPEAIVRVGPLDESSEKHKFRDGTEVELHDRKLIAAGSTNQIWVEVEDGQGRSGWVKSDTLLRLNLTEARSVSAQSR